MKRKSIQISFFIFLVLITFTILFYINNPFDYDDNMDRKIIKESVLINTPTSTVFKVLGYSENARKWSVFVHHITPLNSNIAPDGEVGSSRRCFTQEDETGLKWDEDVVIVELNKRRRITIYNMVDFPFQSKGLVTEQLYEEKENGKCLLSFTLFFENTETNLFDEIKTYISAYYIEDIFRKNLENIKHLSEDGENYKRLYQLESL